MSSQRVQELHRLGSDFKRDGRLAEAEVVYRQAIALAPNDPQIKMALAVVLMSRASYREAWPLYEARFEMAGFRPKPPVPWPEWSGETLTGKRLVIFGEQGLGDQIMFSRFALEQQQAGADVTMLCSRPLVRLFEEAGLRAAAAEGAVEFPDPDYWAMSNSLAGKAGADSGTISGAPYLKARPRPSQARIGVMVSGNPTHHNDAARSLPPPEAQRLLSLQGAMSLAPSDTLASDMAETAEIIGGLDLVISVDTSVAHLAGALGKPVWVLVPGSMTDWRWGEVSSTTPWYETMRLYRQGVGGWATAIDRIVADLLLEVWHAHPVEFRGHST